MRKLTLALNARFDLILDAKSSMQFIGTKTRTTKSENVEIVGKQKVNLFWCPSVLASIVVIVCESVLLLLEFLAC